MRLFRTLILRPLRRDLLRTGLTILAVALGVAVVVAIDLAGDAATGSFRSSLRTLTGDSDLEIRANGGIDEKWMADLSALPFDVKFSPVMEAQATIAGVGSVPLYGLDFLGMDGLVLSRALAVRLNRPGALTLNVAGRPLTFTVARTVDAGTAEFAALDIAAAQQALGRYGKLDRIDVAVGKGEEFASVEQAVRTLLPAGYLIEKPGARSDENQRMLRAFRWNLRVLSYISLVVGAFLIYNTISVSIVRRRGEIGILRATGASRATVFLLFLTEALLFGIAGGVAGAVLGRLLASGTVQLIAVTINALYTTSRPTPVELTAGEWALALGSGIIAALGSAWAPSREAMRVAPTEAMSRGAHEHHARLRWRRGLVWSGAFAVVALALSQTRALDGYPVGGYAAALFCIASAALAAPAVVLLVNRATRAVAGRRVEGLLAGRSLAASLARTSVVVGALATAIAMMASVGIMVGSFRETVSLWLGVQLRADLYAGPAVRSGAGEHPALAAQVPAILAAVPGVAAEDLFHALEFRFRGERATLGAGNAEIVRRYGRLRFLSGEDRDAILQSLPGQDRAIVTEPFANKFGMHVGDRVEIPLGARTVAFTVAGIYYDYSSSQGMVIVDRSTLLRYLPDQPVTNIALYLAPGADAEKVQREMQLRTAGMGVTIAANAELRRLSMQVFDRTFSITWALEAVAIVVAMLGAANSLLALVLDRRRELGLLRYLGASRGQIRGMILAEAAFLGLFATLLGLALGFVLSLLLVFVVNKQSFGWTIQFYPPWVLLGAALLLVWCVTVLAGLYPARVGSRLNPADVMAED